MLLLQKLPQPVADKWIYGLFPFKPGSQNFIMFRQATWLVDPFNYWHYHTSSISWQEFQLSIPIPIKTNSFSHIYSILFKKTVYLQHVQQILALRAWYVIVKCWYRRMNTGRMSVLYTINMAPHHRQLEHKRTCQCIHLHHGHKTKIAAEVALLLLYCQIRYSRHYHRTAL